MKQNSTRRTAQASIFLAAVACAILLTVGQVPAGVALSPPQQSRVVEPREYTPRPRSDESDKGKRLYAKLKCAECHTVAGEGGLAGPPLDGIGARRTEWFMVGQIADPQRFTEEYPELKSWEPSFMRHLEVRERDVHSIVAYLLTLPGPVGGFDVGGHSAQAEPELAAPEGGWSPLPESDRSVKGRKIYFDVGCASCHAIGRYGGMFGPRLDGIGGRHTRPYIEAYVSSPQLTARRRREGGVVPTAMPPLDLSLAEVEAITDFLLTLADRGTP